MTQLVTTTAPTQPVCPGAPQKKSAAIRRVDQENTDVQELFVTRNYRNIKVARA